MDTLIQRLEITAEELEDKNLKPMAATVREAIKALSDNRSERHQVDAGVSPICDWIRLVDHKPDVGIEVLLFKREWISEYNPKGIRIGFWDDVTGWTSAYWCNHHDEYHTRISEEDDDQFEDFVGANQIPTHWKPKPEPPREG